MITEFTIEGFKSFGTPAQTVRLGALNFIVGANASGKTNLLSALRFLKSVVLQDAEFAVNDFGGVVEVRNRLLRKRTKPKPLAIRVKLEIAKGDGVQIAGPAKGGYEISSIDYRIELDLRSDNNVPQFDSEELLVDLRDKSGRKIEYRLDRTQNVVKVTDPIWGDENEPRKIDVPPQETARSAVGGLGFFSIPGVVLRQIIGGWRFYNINPSIARASFKETPDVDLGPSGEFLSVIIHKLEQQNTKNGLDQIISGLRGVIPGFRGIKPTHLPLEGKWAFQVLEDNIRGAINPDSVSDGTIRLLALMVIASRTGKGSPSPLIAIEEPENGLHPHVSEHVIQILRTAAERRQVIVTTHNPVFLDYLQPEEVILCDKTDGFTHLRRASEIEEIRSFQKHFHLGELWTQGVLGGIP